MTVTATEVGRTIRIGTRYDLSSFSDLELMITAPDLSSETLKNSVATRVTAPSVQVSDATVGTLPADTYMEMVTDATDFTQTGDYSITPVYVDATPKRLYGETVTLTVSAAP